MKYIILTLFLACFVFFKPAAQEEKKRKWELNGYVKDLQSELFENIDSNWLSNNMLHNRLNFKWFMNDKFTFSAEARTRLIWGDFISLVPDYGEMLETDPGYLDLTENVLNGKNYLLNTSLDRLWLSYTKGKWQFTLGRQRINWGQTFAWNPNDIFNAYSYFDFDYEEKPGSDAIRIVYSKTETSSLELAAKIDRNKKTTSAMLYRFNKFHYDFQFLGGLLNDSNIVAGAGFSGSLFKGSLRGELSYIHPAEFGDTNGNVIASLGYDYIFNNSSMLQFEFIYNGFGSNSDSLLLNDYFFADAGITNLVYSRYAAFASYAYTVSPVLNLSISLMHIPVANTFFIMPMVDWSPAQNFNISLLAQSFLSSSDLPGSEGTFVFLRLKAAF